jgi:hypothetical protein
MGADGGLTWMSVHETKKLDRAKLLIQPLGILDDKMRDEDHRYIDEHHPIDWSTDIVARYGTDLNHDGMRELYEILAYMEDDSRTFEEVALDIATRPDWQMYQMGTFEKAVHRLCDWSSWYDYHGFSPFWSDRAKVIEERPSKRLKVASEEALQRLDDIRHMKVVDWTAELKRLLVWERYGTVETWT